MVFDAPNVQYALLFGAVMLSAEAVGKIATVQAATTARVLENILTSTRGYNNDGGIRALRRGEDDARKIRTRGGTVKKSECEGDVANALLRAGCS